MSIIPGTEFTDVWLYSTDTVGRDGAERASCRTLRFVREQTFEMTSPSGPKGFVFDPSLMNGVLVIYAGGRSRGILHGVRQSENAPTNPNVWWGTFDRGEVFLGNPLFRWQQDKFRGGMEKAAQFVGIPLDRYIVLVDGNAAPTPEEVRTIAARTGIPHRDLEQWADHRRTKPSR